MRHSASVVLHQVRVIKTAIGSQRRRVFLGLVMLLLFLPSVTLPRAGTSALNSEMIPDFNTMAMANAPSLLTVGDPPVIEMPSAVFVLIPPNAALGSGTVFAVMYDPDPPYIVVFAEFWAFSFGDCFVAYVDGIYAPIQIPLPNGEVVLGSGFFGQADFIGFRNIFTPTPGVDWCGGVVASAIDAEGIPTGAFTDVILIVL